MRPDQNQPTEKHAASLIETEQVFADAAAGIDHMGRRHAATIGEAFRMDWPWILAAVVLTAYVIASLAGYFRL
jgi:hypothetical protein